MLRVALIAYLGLTTVLGPLLCCCNAQQLFVLVAGTTCCGKLAQRDVPVPKPHDHCSHHGHSHHPHDSPVAKDNETSGLPSGEQRHDKHDCPCGEHHAKLVAVVTDVAHWNGGDLIGQPWSALAVSTFGLPEFGGYLADHTAGIPAHLYGREILRAYQIMRC